MNGSLYYLNETEERTKNIRRQYNKGYTETLYTIREILYRTRTRQRHIVFGIIVILLMNTR
jgi:hypothetical protein